MCYNILVPSSRISARSEQNLANPYHGCPRNKTKILTSSQASSRERTERNEIAKKHRKMTFNQILFLENIERIVGVLSFSKRFVGKNYVSTLNIDVSSAFFCFESVKSSTRAFS